MTLSCVERSGVQRLSRPVGELQSLNVAAKKTLTAVMRWSSVLHMLSQYLHAGWLASLYENSTKHYCLVSARHAS